MTGAIQKSLDEDRKMQDEIKLVIQELFGKHKYTKAQFINMVASAINYVEERDNNGWRTYDAPGVCAFCGSLTCSGGCFK